MKRVRVLALYTFFIVWLLATTLYHQRTYWGDAAQTCLQAPIGTDVSEGAYQVHSFVPLGTTCVSSDGNGSLRSVFLPEPWWDFGILVPVGVAIFVLELRNARRPRP